jgi:hypothetical protein
MLPDVRRDARGGGGMTREAYRPEAVTDIGGRYRMGTGHLLECRAVETDRALFAVVECPCAGSTIPRGQVCRGHDNPIGFDWATWKYHCATGWAKQLREAVRA